MVGVSNALREMGDVLGAIENVATDDETVRILTVSPSNQEYLSDERVSITFRLGFPFLRSQSLGRAATLTPGDVQLADDGSLHVDFEATVEPPEKPHARDELERAESTTNEGAKTESDDREADERTAAEPNQEGASAEANGSEPETSPEEMTGSEAEAPDRASRESDTDAASDGHSSLPAYRNPDRLREVYDEYDTFAEMTDALDVDVTPQTVRRYTIQHGIHEPSSRSGPTSADSLLEMDPNAIPALDREGARKGESEARSTDGSQALGETTLVTDGEGPATEPDAKTDASREESTDVGSSSDTEETETPARHRDISESDDAVSPGNSAEEGDQPCTGSDVVDAVDLPSHLTVTEVKAVVKEVSTLYEAQQHLHLERDEARRLLQGLNLLDLVHGRVATRGSKERTIEDINRRIRSATTSAKANGN